MPTGFDHVVIAVTNLDAAERDYSAAGFTVSPGGEHITGHTHNALVAFADGAYLELIAWRQPDPGRPWYDRLESGEGLIDFALRTDDIDAEVERLRATGLNVPDPVDGGRERPDGQRVEWRNLRFDDGMSSAIPFYCHSTNDRGLRVPSGDATRHDNGVTGIAGISVLVNDLKAVALDYGRIAGARGVEDEATVAPWEDANRFQIGRAGRWVELIAPDDTASVAASALMARGELPYEVTLEVSGEAEVASQMLPIDLTHGARLLLVTAETVDPD